MKSTFKKYFIAGALVLVPIVMTVWILRAMILWCEAIFTSLVPASWQPVSLLGYEIPGLGLVFTIALILLTGVLTRLYVGTKLLSLWNYCINRIPFGNTVYRAIHQLVNTLASPGRNNFRQVVLIEFPIRGNYTMGFITGECPANIQGHLNQKMVNVFVPTSPNPTSGFLILAPQENLLTVDMPPEQAFKLIISGGTISV